MKLTENDKQILKEWGHPDADMPQIEEATGKTIYKLNFKKRISAKRTIELLGRTEFLSGISRSAFHITAVRNIENTDDVVYFDSSALFK